MNRLAKVINELDNEELALLKKDLDEGNISRLIAQKIKESHESSWNRVCPVCQSPIKEESMTLMFGPKDLRKKASFCAPDCLEYFLHMLKEQVKN
jgi:hypothetical protein